jgi:hypothetical protein
MYIAASVPYMQAPFREMPMRAEVQSMVDSIKQAMSLLRRHL